MIQLNHLDRSLAAPNVADHIKLVSYDAVGYALAVDALTHDGPADPARIDRGVCDEEFHPGVDAATFPTNCLNGVATAMHRQVTGERVDRESALRPYVTGR